MPSRPLDGGRDVRPLCLRGVRGGASPDSARPRVFALDGDKWKEGRDPSHVRKGGCGIGINEADVSYTLTVTDRHIVAIAAV